MKVQCPSCKKVCHKTTDTFNPDILPNGSMVELLDPWKSWGWGKFGDYRNGGAEVMGSDMECPCCECPLAPSGRLTVVGDDYLPIPRVKTLSEMNQERIALLMADDEPVYGKSVVEMIEDVRGEIDTILSDNTFICSECGWTGKTAPALKRHMTMRHQ